MGDSNWKRMLKSQHADLEKLEAMDAELNDVKIAQDIEIALKKTKLPSSYSSHIASRRLQQADPDDEKDDDEEEYNYRSRPPPPNPSSRPSSAPAVRPSSAAAARKEVGFSPTSRTRANDDSNTSPRISTSQSYRGTDDRSQGQNADGAESPDNGTPKAPDATARYQKARLKLLSKQVEDGQELRKQLSETVNDLQRQLKNEREENKKAKKRIQLLEVETKRSSNRRVSEADANQASDTVDSLTQEVALLKKDIQTAERIAKQSEVIAKSKDTHLKRALETITRLKQQVTELQSTAQEDNSGERTKLDVSESRVKLLTRQRDDLISAFKKQMKLIDVLKRQKVHIEAARLLAFTEDEFVRTLDWGA